MLYLSENTVIVWDSLTNGGVLIQIYGGLQIDARWQNQPAWECGGSADVCNSIQIVMRVCSAN